MVNIVFWVDMILLVYRASISLMVGPSMETMHACSEDIKVFLHWVGARASLQWRDISQPREDYVN